MISIRKLGTEMKITLNQKSAIFSSCVFLLVTILCVLFLFLIADFYLKRLGNVNASFELSPDELLNEQWTQIKVFLITKKTILRDFNSEIIKKQSLVRLNPNKPHCSLMPAYNLTGFIHVYKAPSDFSVFNDSIFSNLLDKSPNLTEWMRQFGENIKQGGRWEPPECQARHRLAIIVPYRDRLENLNGFLHHMHPFLQRQQIAYRVFVVEQQGNGIFNKGILMNTAFIHALNLTNLGNFSQYLSRNSSEFPFDCVTFHDVDLLPEGNFSKYVISLKSLMVE